MIGYGKCFYDNHNNLPLLRWGKLVSDSDKDLDNFVVDLNVLHGSSG